MRLILLLFLLTVSTQAGQRAPANPLHTLQALQEKVLNCAQRLQKTEENIKRFREELAALSKKEKTFFETLRKNQDRLFIVLHHLRHLSSYSPTLASLSSDSPDDFIRSNLLLRSMTPIIANKNSDVFDMLRGLSKTRREIIHFKSQLNTSQRAYNNESAELNSVIKNKLTFQQNYGMIPAPRHTQTAPIYPEQQNDLVHHVINNVLRTQDNTVSVGDSLVVGRMAVGHFSPSKQNQHQINIVTTPNGLVTAPFDGTIVYTGYVKGTGAMVILHYYDYFMVMGGVDTLTCQTGQVMKKGEPVGRMSTRDEPILSVQLYQFEEPVSLLNHLQEKNRD